MTEKFVIIGAGGYADTVLSIFEASIDAGMDYDVLGYIVGAQYGRPGILINDKPILGDFDWLAKHKNEFMAVSAVGYSTLRRQLVLLAQDYDVRFGSSLAYPAASEGVCARCRIQQIINSKVRMNLMNIIYS